MKRLMVVCLVLTAMCVMAIAGAQSSVAKKFVHRNAIAKSAPTTGVTAPVRAEKTLPRVIVGPNSSPLAAIGASTPTTERTIKDRVDALLTETKRLKASGDEAAYLSSLARLNAARAEYDRYLGVTEKPRALRCQDNPTGETCATAMALTVPGAVTGTTCGHLDDYFHTCGGQDGRHSPDVVFSFSPAADMQVTFDLCGSDFDTKIYVNEDACDNTPIGCNDDFCDVQSKIECLQLHAGHTYYVIIDGWGNGTCGNYVLVTTVCETTPVGETCADAIPLTVPSTVDGTTCNHVNDYDAVCPYEGSTSPDVVYSFTPEENENVTFDLGQSGYDTKIYIYQDQCGGDVIACNDDFYPNYRSKLECVPLSAGHTYYIVVDGYNGACGDYILISSICEQEQRPPCGPNSTVSQPPALPTEVWSAFTSDLQFPYLVYDNFSGAGAAVCDIQFWGLELFFDNGFVTCDSEDPMTFQVTFYPDAAGVPGAATCTYTVTATRQATGFTYNDFPLWMWSASLTPCCALDAGWVSVQGTGVGSPNCAFLWMNSLTGDGLSYQSDASGNLGQLSYDLAFCLTPGEAPVGRCCYDFATPTCEMITQAACQELEGSWDPTLTCDVPCVPTCVVCPENGIHENETCPLNPDDFNGGCNSTPPVFTNVECGMTICGTAWFDGNTRDTDWYRLALLSPQAVTMRVTASFPVFFGFIEFNAGFDGSGEDACSHITGFLNPSVVSEACLDTAVTSTLPAGTWYLFVAPQFTGTIIPCSPYTMQVECVPAELGRCCYGVTAPLCATNTLEQCEELQGVWHPNEACEGPFCELEPNGRCCYLNSDHHLSCADNTREECATLQGEWNPDLTCETPCVPPPPEGRCCYVEPTGLATCAVKTEAECRVLYGTWAEGLTCDEPCQQNCSFPYELVDMGDLPACDYPTLVNNPGHGLSGVAWLGNTVTGEAAPLNLLLDRSQWCESPGNQDRGRDTGDDGVAYFGQPWMPCTMVSVLIQVTAGPNYNRYVECGHHLYLNGWKDGNLDGDFCDILCEGDAPEWIVQDQIVTPGLNPFTFEDPGVFNLGVYAGVFRWRLTSHPVGSQGFGLVDNEECGNMQCGTFALDYLGEVEDYFLCDVQLPVELTSLTAVPASNQVTINWVTASETANNYFEVVRDGATVGHIPSQGNDANGHTYQFVDNHVENGTVYNYSLAAVDLSGKRSILRSVDAAPKAGVGMVTEYALHQNYPNPFNPSTHIGFDLPEAGFVTLKVYNVMGQEVATLVNGNQAAGQHMLNFEAGTLPSGLYLYRMTAGTFVGEKKMLIMK